MADKLFFDEIERQAKEAKSKKKKKGGK